MDEPKALDGIFREKLFRIPDYQRGYAWRLEQLEDFWEDLVNLSGTRSHYTGVLTLKEVPAGDVQPSDKAHWLVEDHGYRLYDVVDGQQRLTTFVILLKAFVDFFKSLPEHADLAPEDVFVTESLNVAAIEEKFLFKTKPTGDRFRTYKFGYAVDNPSYLYLRHMILGEPGRGSIEETFYTLNLDNAKRYFAGQLNALHAEDGLDAVRELYRKLTKRFLLNEYVIRDEFDVFVAFETMNNRGKQLSNLELLKNRLIYLTTLYDEHELDEAERSSLRERINSAWKEVYHQLGRNRRQPLNDDDFLRAHWTMYFTYSRKRGDDYIRYLLDEQFTPKKVHKKVPLAVELESPVDVRDDLEAEIEDPMDEDRHEKPSGRAQLGPMEIREYVTSLKESAVHWFNSYYPKRAEGMDSRERDSLDRLNRVGIIYFRPLVMAILKNVDDVDERIEVFDEIERFIFITFRMCGARSNYGSSVFYRMTKSIDRGTKSLADVRDRLAKRMSHAFHEDGSFDTNDFYVVMEKRFENGNGYYGWAGLRYMLYEYELGLLAQSRQPKVHWDDLLKTQSDKISIEHIYPQSGAGVWKKVFAGIKPKVRARYQGSLGNLLLLSMAINSSLQDDAFEDKKRPKLASDGRKLRNGYADGSHSEIEVANYESWGPDEIRHRGLRLLTFMEHRWRIRFRDESDKVEMLFLDD